MSFTDKELQAKWNNFVLVNKNDKALYEFFSLVLDKNEILIKPHEILTLFAAEQQQPWPDDIFYHLNEELTRLNRVIIKINAPQQHAPQQQHQHSLDVENFSKLHDILRVCLVFSK